MYTDQIQMYLRKATSTEFQQKQYLKWETGNPQGVISNIQTLNPSMQSQINNNILNNLNKQAQNILMMSHNGGLLNVGNYNNAQGNLKTPKGKKPKKILLSQTANITQINNGLLLQGQGQMNQQIMMEALKLCEEFPESDQYVITTQAQQYQAELIQQQMIMMQEAQQQVEEETIEQFNKAVIEPEEKQIKLQIKSKQKAKLKKSQNTIASQQSKQAVKEQITIISSNLLPLQPQQPQIQGKKATNTKQSQENQQQIVNPQQQKQQNQMANLKQGLIQTIQEVVKPVVSRSEDMNFLKQIIDIKNRKLKPKYTDSTVFFNILQKENQRQQVEAFHLNKTANIRIDDKPIIKKLQKSVKKMLKPFKGLNFDDFLHAEIHLNEIMVSQQDSQQMEQMKESRKRHMRILQAALKECIVDPSVCIAICVQVSRQAFFNELKDYFQCAHENIINGQLPAQTTSTNNNSGNTNTNSTQSEILNYQNLKKLIQKANVQSKVQIQHNKKIDKIFKVLFEQNVHVLKQISTYKDKYDQKKITDQIQSEQDTPTYFTRNRDSTLNTGRNQSAIDFIKETNYIINLPNTKKKQTISLDQNPDLLKANTGHKVTLSRSGNQTMQNFYNTPQVKVTSKIDPNMITVRLGNQKAVTTNSNSKVLAPIQKMNISSKGTTHTTESLYDSQQIYLENLDLKNLKRLNQLPSIQHQHLNSGVSTPIGNQAQLSGKDSGHRGNSAENLLKLLYQNKKKKLLEPIRKNKHEQTMKKPMTNNPLMTQDNRIQIAKLNSSPPKMQKHSSQTRVEMAQGRNRNQSQGKTNKIIINHASFTVKETNNESQQDLNNKSLGSINLKQSLSNNNMSRMVRTSNMQVRNKFAMFNRMTTQNLEIYDKFRTPTKSLHHQQQSSYEYRISEQLDAYLTRYFNKKEIINFMINHQAKIIQWAWKERFEQKIQAKNFILKYWKLHRQYMVRCQNLDTKIYLINHKRAARIIEKAYSLYRIRKRFRSWNQFIDYSKISGFMAKVVMIQRAVRKRQMSNYTEYRQISKCYNHFVNEFNKLKQKYIPQVILDSRRIQNDMYFSLQCQQLDEYISVQQNNYITDLQKYEQKLEEAVEENLDKREWNFNSASREWTNQRLNLTLKNHYANGQQPQITTPLQKLLECNRLSFMPNSQQQQKFLESLRTIKAKMIHQLNMDRLETNWELEMALKLNRIKQIDQSFD
ncbi:UNKNOWN [Stylonychia lemnae]|uniref:Uncharacterized protein n=1 Tax=Stylonychia lemnae TaxID=5949 RepID=A0A078AE70_STYLE|nr:UNKNOWN [Stylonychia lemnae]|eukprot:CDW80131.1 UNKNOWN [Stylonychia lemnae]